MELFFKQDYCGLMDLAEKEAKYIADAVFHSFDGLDDIGEFVDIVFYMHSITDDEQFTIFLGIIYDIFGYQIPEAMDYQIVMSENPNIFFTCFLSSLLTEILNKVGGEIPCPVK